MAMQMESGNMWTYDWTLSLSTMFSFHPCCNVYQHFSSFVWLNNIPLYGQTTVCLSLWLVSTFGFYECHAAMESSIRVFVWTCVLVSPG